MPSAHGGGYAGAGYASKSYGGKLPDSAGTPQTVTIGAAASAGAFGIYVTSVTVPGNGGIAPPAITGPKVNRTVPMLGEGPGEAWGLPYLTQTQFRAIIGTATSFAAGLYSTSLTIPMQATGSSEAWGGIRIGRGFLLGSALSAETIPGPIVAYSVPMWPVAPTDAYGLYSTSLTIPLNITPTDEAAGRFLTNITVPLQGVASAELVEQPHSVGLVVGMEGAPTAFNTGGVIAAPGPLTVRMLGPPAFFTAGGLSLSYTLRLHDISSSEAVPTFRAVRTQTHLVGSSTGEDFGNPTIPIVPVTIDVGKGIGFPQVSLNITLRLVAIASQEAAGELIVGTIILLQGVASEETVTELPRVFPVAGFTEAAFGEPSISVPVVDQTLAVASADSAEEFGQFGTLTATVLFDGVAPGDVGAPFITRQVRPVGVAPGAAGRPSVRTFVIDFAGAGVPSSEAVGLPNFPAPQSVGIGGVGTGFDSGLFFWTRGIFFFLIGIATEETVLGPNFGFGGVSRNMQGLASSSVVSFVHYPQTFGVGGAASSETFGTPEVSDIIAPIGVSSHAAVGGPGYPILGPVTLSLIGAVSAEQVSPAHYKQTIAPLGVVSTETFGGLSTRMGLSFIGIPTGQGFGLYSTSLLWRLLGIAAPSLQVGQQTIHVTVPMQGTDSAENVGSPHPVELIVPQSTDPDEALGQILTSITVPFDAIGPGAPGQPRAPDQTEHLDDTGPDEAFGEPHITLVVRVQSTDPDEAFGQYDTSLTVPMRAVLPGDAGQPAVSSHWTGTATAVPSEESFGLPAAPAYLERTDATPSDEAVGEPSIALAVPLKSVVDSEAAGAFRTWLFEPMAWTVPGEWFGQPPEPAYTQHLDGTASSEAFGLATTIQTVSIIGTASGEDVGLPAQLAQTEHLGGADTAEAAGAPSTPAYTEHPQGADSAEAEGDLWVIQTVHLQGTESAEAVALVAPPAYAEHLADTDSAELVAGPQINLTIPIGGSASEEQPGLPAPPAQTEHLDGTDTAEAVGAFRTWLFEPLGGVGSDETFGEPQQPAQTEHLDGAASAEALGDPTIHLTVPIEATSSAEELGRPAPPAYTEHLADTASAELVAGPQINLTVPMAGADSAEESGEPAPPFYTQHLEGAGSAEDVSAFRTWLFEPIDGCPSEETFGDPEPPAQTEYLQGTDSAEVVPGPYETITLYPIAIETGEDVGLPDQLVQTEHLGDIASDETWGVYVTSVTVPMAGIESGEAFTGPKEDGVEPMVGIDSEENFGEWRTWLFEPLGDTPTAEAVGDVWTVQTEHIGDIAPGDAGAPDQPHQTISLIGVETAEVVDDYFVHLTEHPEPIVTEEAPGEPAPPAYTLHLEPVESAEQAGDPQLDLTWFFDGIASGEDVGVPNPPDYTERLDGTDSDQLVTEPQIELTVPLSDIGSDEAAGEPFVHQGIPAEGISTEELVASPQINITVPIEGTESGETVSAFEVDITVPVAGTESSAVVGDPEVDLTVPMRGTESAEVVGTFYTHLTEHPEPIVSEEQVGAPDAPSQLIRVADISEEAFGEALVEIRNGLDSTPSDEALGEPGLYLLYTIALDGLDSAEATGDITVHRVVPVGGAASDETFGDAWTRQTERIAPVAPDEQTGAPARPAQMLHPIGTESSESFGTIWPITLVHLDGAVTAEAVSAFRTNFLFRMWGVSEYVFEPHVSKFGNPTILTWVFGGQLIGIPSAEVVGRPSLPAAVEHPIGIASGEAVGRTGVPGQVIHLGDIASGFRTAGPNLGQQIHILPEGVVSREAVGAIGAPSMAVRLSGAASSERTGTPRVNRTQPLAGAPSAQRFGLPLVVQYLQPKSCSPTEATGQPAITMRLRITGTASEETSGRPRLALTVPMRGVVPAATGLPRIRSVLLVLPGDAGTGEHSGAPIVSASVRVRPGGAPSGQVAGYPSFVTVTYIDPAVIESSERVGAVIIHTGSKRLVPYHLDTAVSTRSQSVLLRGRSLKVEVLPVASSTSVLEEQQLVPDTEATAAATDVLRRATQVIAGPVALWIVAAGRSLTTWVEGIDAVATVADRIVVTEEEQRDTSSSMSNVTTVWDADVDGQPS